MSDDEHKTENHEPAAEATPGGKAEEAVVSRPDLQPRNLSRNERESLRARLQKKFH